MRVHLVERHVGAGVGADDGEGGLEPGEVPRLRRRTAGSRRAHPPGTDEERRERALVDDRCVDLVGDDDDVVAVARSRRAPRARPPCGPCRSGSAGCTAGMPPAHLPRSPHRTSGRGRRGRVGPFASSGASTTRSTGHLDEVEEGVVDGRGHDHRPARIGDPADDLAQPDHDVGDGGDARRFDGPRPGVGGIRDCCVDEVVDPADSPCRRDAGQPSPPRRPARRARHPSRPPTAGGRPAA